MVYFTGGLQDISAIMGQSTEMVCKLSAHCDGVWYKDGKEVRGLVISYAETIAFLFTLLV